MSRILSTSLLTLVVCALQSGCCRCCVGLPMFRPQPVVIQQPQIEIKPPTADFTYVQSTGQLKKGNDIVGTGYSGKGPGKNNAAMQGQKDGPIPAGRYWISQMRNDPKTGEKMFAVQPDGADVFGRWPGESFDIQPDSMPPGNAPGIVMPRDVRERIQIGPFTKLDVVP